MASYRLVSTLHALRHVPGVLGSFLWMGDGRLLASDLTPGPAASVLQLASKRLASVAAAYASAGECLEHITLAYEKYQLHISGVADATLVVVLTRASTVSVVVPAIDAVLRELGRMPELGMVSPLGAADGAQAAAAARSYRGGRIFE
jgi:hypothetical protein